MRSKLERSESIHVILLITMYPLAAGTSVHLVQYLHSLYSYVAKQSQKNWTTYSISRELGDAVIDNYTEVKAVHVNLTIPPP